jgi:hypothetical protein
MGSASLIALLLLSLGSFSSKLWAGVAGTFRGEIVRAPQGEPSVGLLYLMGQDGNVRRVVVKTAAIVYDTTVPTAERVHPARKSLIPGAEVRVTALVDAKSGEWTASRVEVIAHHSAEFDDDYDEDGTAPDEVTAPNEGFPDLRTI